MWNAKWVLVAVMLVVGACAGDDLVDQVDAAADAALQRDAAPDAALQRDAAADAAPDAEPDDPSCSAEHQPACNQTGCDPGLHSVHVTPGAPQTCEALPLHPGACGGLYEACCEGETCPAAEFLGCDLSYGMMLCVD